MRYGIDVEYLEVGTAYLVSARRDPVIGLLASKIREPAPLLGGDDVVGVAESDVECPRLDDPIRTLLPDGSSIDSAVLAPLGEHRTQLVGGVPHPARRRVRDHLRARHVALGVTGLLRGDRVGRASHARRDDDRRRRERLDRAAPVVDRDLLGGLADTATDEHAADDRFAEHPLDRDAVGRQLPAVAGDPFVAHVAVPVHWSVL